MAIFVIEIASRVEHVSQGPGQNGLADNVAIREISESVKYANSLGAIADIHQRGAQTAARSAADVHKALLVKAQTTPESISVVNPERLLDLVQTFQDKARM